MKKIAYSGVPGCFAHMAARQLYADELYVAFEDFGAAYDAVVSGGCDLAVLPIRNSYAGDVADVSDLLAREELRVVKTYDMPIVQNLLGIRGSRPGDIKTVISQQKALEQCDEYIKAHGYRIRTSTNTAVAAKEVIEGCNMSVAAIGSLETAATYGLKVLDEKINSRDDNITTFAVVEKCD
ncbi:MAG: hypothetical protein K6F28_11055 [Lachnospiraceae bacterium]|nr:hypothetical protein [Lachnospiraceae bacterium]